MNSHLSWLVARGACLPHPPTPSPTPPPHKKNNFKKLYIKKIFQKLVAKMKINILCEIFEIEKLLNI